MRRFGVNTRWNISSVAYHMPGVFELAYARHFRTGAMGEADNHLRERDNGARTT